ncbi:MAG: hypothetical protein HFE46_05365 [Clostridia bacterium]|nr:hypothetical protein [Clostridia bacterium]
MPKQRCCHCMHYSRYYTKGQIKFNSTKHGWCVQCAAVKKFSDTCEKFRGRPYRKRMTYYAQITLHRLLNELTALRQAVEDEQPYESEDNALL